MIKSFFIFLVLFSNISILGASYDQNKILEKASKYLVSENPSFVLKVNKKINIPTCHGEIQIKKKYKNYKTLEINCLGKQAWKYNLRTNISSQYEHKNKKKVIKKKKVGVLVSIKSLNKGHLVLKQDLKLKYLSNLGSSNSFSNLNDVIGRKLKTTIKQGQILRERHLEKDWLISEGQKVKIEHKNKNLIIIVDGIALESGIKGDYLKVKNENSGKTIKGWVKNNKKITIFR